MKKVILIMGICGSGKTTVGKALSTSLGIPFLDADDFHPKSNVQKMSGGQPLTDDDRWPWLAAIVEHILNSHRDSFILGCSALKESYRSYLSQRLSIHPVLLDITFKEAEQRLNSRKGHFMPAELIKSQLETLEVPESGLVIPASMELSESIDLLRQNFRKLI